MDKAMRCINFLVFLNFFLGGITFSQTTPNLTEVGHYKNPEDASISDCWGYTSEDGRNYAILGVQKGVRVIDLDDPANPRLVSFIPGGSSACGGGDFAADGRRYPELPRPTWTSCRTRTVARVRRAWLQSGSRTIGRTLSSTG